MAEGDGNLSTGLENLDVAIDALDDIEFDLPVVDTPPSLESILNEQDADDVFSEEDFQFLQGESSETTSMASYDSLDEKKKRSRKSITYEEHGSILRHVMLKNVSGQLMSAADRVDAGLPTAMAVSSLIAVGTSHGLVLVFDPKQVLKWCLGSTAVGAQYGAVSALSFNRDCTRLLCGFAKGQITMWDLTNGKLLRTIADAHPPGSAVLHVKFTDDLTVAVCSDSGGSVFELEMKRLIGVRTCESKCLFSGSRGEVCALEPLHMNYTIKDHPMKDVMILAMASLSKVLIVTLRPQLKVMFTYPVKGDPATLPLLAWQFVIIQVSEKDRVIDPVLAFARESTINFFQVICNSPEDIKFAQLQVMNLEYKLLAIAWINTRTLLTLDVHERIHVLDVRSETELEVIDIAEIQLVYGTSHFKSLATGGNVSKALAYAGDHACYQSLVGANGQILLLGTKSIHVMTIRNWEERLDVLVKQNNYHGALALAQSFYDGTARAVVGLLGGAKNRKETVANKMLELLYNYVDLSMTKFCPERGRIEALEEYYQDVVPVCVDYCLHLRRIDVLFGRIYERFSKDIIARGTFLECLQPYILDDKLTSVTPAVMKDFVEHYTSKGMMQNVENCVVHLDVASLDIHQIVVLCWQNGLYDAILYVYNKGMNDYTSPLEELLTVLQMALKTGKQLTDDQIKLGNKLLVYISCCLAGRAYPLGDIPEHLVHEVKEKVFQCMTCLHSQDADPEEPAYPYLRTLLQYDTREFLNVLALAFEEVEFNTTEGIQKRQRVVDILLQVMVESVGFSPTQVGILFTFLARQMARHDNTIIVNRLLFEQVLEFLSQPGDDTRHEERQQALMELLQAGGLQQFDEERLLMLAENAKFFRVCELLYEKRRQFDKILSCYWRDSARKHQAFSYIQTILLSDQYATEEKRKVQDEALKHLSELVSIDQKDTAKLIIRGFPDRLNDIIKSLEGEPETLFKFLKGVFDYREANGSAIYTDKQITIDAEVNENYINLMCQYQPNMVYHYIVRSEGHRLEQTLEICRRHKVLDAVAYLLEKTGDIQGAFGILLENLQNKVKDVLMLLEKTQSGSPDRDLSLAIDTMKANLLVIIQLCQRSSGKMNENEREALWFPLLETMMMPQRKLKNIDKKYSEVFKEQTRHILNSMMGYIGPPAILQNIMQDPSYSTGKFGEIKELILGMLDTCNYEKTLRHTCINLLNYDLHMHLAGLQETANKGFIARGEVCNLCTKTYTSGTETDDIIVFRCGHSYHSTCLQTRGGCRVIDGEEEWVCSLCARSQRGRQQPVHFQRQQSNPSTSNGPQVTTSSSQVMSKQVALSSQQLMAMENLRKSQKTKSRLLVLNELSKQDRGTSYRTGSVLQNQQFQLRLAPPPIPE